VVDWDLDQVFTDIQEHQTQVVVVVAVATAQQVLHQILMLEGQAAAELLLLDIFQCNHQVFHKVLPQQDHNHGFARQTFIV
jgi:hypothetical protein